MGSAEHRVNLQSLKNYCLERFCVVPCPIHGNSPFMGCSSWRRYKGWQEQINILFIEQGFWTSCCCVMYVGSGPDSLPILLGEDITHFLFLPWCWLWSKKIKYNFTPSWRPGANFLFEYNPVCDCLFLYALHKCHCLQYHPGELVSHKIYVGIYQGLLHG